MNLRFFVLVVVKLENGSFHSQRSPDMGKLENKQGFPKKTRSGSWLCRDPSPLAMKVRLV